VQHVSAGEGILTANHRLSINTSLVFGHFLRGEYEGPIQDTFVSQSDARQQTLMVGSFINTTTAASEVADETTAQNRETIATTLVPENMNVELLTIMKTPLLPQGSKYISTFCEIVSLDCQRQNTLR
jgi:hypothetical protein